MQGRIRLLGFLFLGFFFGIQGLIFAEDPQVCDPNDPNAKAASDSIHPLQVFQKFEIKRKANPSVSTNSAAATKPANPQAVMGALAPAAQAPAASVAKAESKIYPPKPVTMSAEELQRKADGVFRFFQQKNYLKPITEDGRKNWRAVYGDYQLPIETGRPDYATNLTLANSVEALLAYYLRWNNPKMAQSRQSFQFDDFPLRNDPTLIQAFNLSKDDPRTLLQFIFDDLLKDPARRRQLIDQTEGLRAFNRETKDLLERDHPDWWRELQSQMNQLPDQSPSGKSLDRSRLLPLAVIQEFAAKSKALQDDIRKAQGEAAGQTKPWEVYKPMYLERLKKLVEASGKFEPEMLVAAFEFSSQNLLDYEKRKNDAVDIAKVEAESAAMKTLYSNYDTPGSYRMGSSLEDHANARIAQLQTKMGIEVRRGEGVVDLSDFIKDKPEPGITGFGAVKDLNLNAQELDELRKRISKEVEEEFSKVTINTDPEDPLIKSKPYLNPKLYLSTSSALVSEYQKSYLDEGQKIGTHGYWVQSVGGETVAVDRNYFEHAKRSAIKKRVDEIIQNYGAHDFFISLNRLMQDAERYGEAGFYADSKPVEKNTRWNDPILGRARDPKTAFFDFKAEVERKYWLALSIVQGVKGYESVKSLPNVFSFLLTLPNQDLEELAFVRKFLPAYADSFVKSRGKEKLPFENLHVVWKATIAWKRILDQLGLDTEGKFETLEQLAESVQTLYEESNKRTELFGGVKPAFLGCFDGKVAGQFLPQGELQGLSYQEFQSQFYPDKSKALKISLTAAEILSKLKACGEIWESRRSDLAANLKSSFTRAVRTVMLQRIEAHVKARFLAEELRAAEKEPGKKSKEFFERLDAELPLNDQTSDEKMAERGKKLVELLMSGTNEENNVLSQIVLNLYMAPTDKLNPLQVRYAEEIKKLLHQDEIRQLDASLKNASLKSEGKEGLRNAYETQRLSVRYFKDMNFSHWSVAELDSLRFIASRFGWFEPFFLNGERVALETMFRWIARNQVEGNENGIAIIKPRLSLSNSTELLNRAEELAKAAVLLPTVWGPQWKEILLADMKKANPDAEMTAASILSYGNGESAKIFKIVAEDQIESWNTYGYDRRANHFVNPRELEGLKQLEVGTLEKLKIWKVPVEEMAPKLRAMMALRVWKELEEKYRKWLNEEDRDPEEKAARLKELENKGNYPPPGLVEYMRDSQNLKGNLVEAERMGLMKPEHPLPMVDAFAAKTIDSVHQNIVNTMRLGLRSYDFFMQDFFGKPDELLTKETHQLLRNLPKSSDPVLQTLTILGFNTEAPAMRQVLSEIREKNPELFRDLGSLSERFFKSSVELSESMVEPGGLEREEFLKILSLSITNREFRDALLGLAASNLPTKEEKKKKEVTDDSGRVAIEGYEISSSDLKESLTLGLAKNNARKILELAGLSYEKNPSGEKRKDISKAARQLEYLRSMILAGQQIFPEFRDSLSDSVLKYAVPILIRQAQMSPGKTDLEKVLVDQGGLYHEAAEKRLTAMSEVSSLGVLTDIQALSGIFGNAHGKNGFDYAKIDEELSNIMGQAHELYRLLYGKKYDMKGQGWEADREEGFERLARNAAFQQNRNDWTQSYQPQLVAKIQALSKAKAESVEKIKKALSPEMQTSPEVQKLLRTLDEPWKVNIQINTGVPPWAALEVTSLFRLALKRDDLKTDLRPFREGILDQVVALSSLPLEPISIVLGPATTDRQRQPYSKDREVFEREYRSKYSYRAELGRSFRMQTENEKIERLLDIAGEKRDFHSVLVDRLAGLGDLFNILKVPGSFDREKAADLLSRLYENGYIEPDRLFVTLNAILQVRMGHHEINGSYWLVRGADGKLDEASALRLKDANDQIAKMIKALNDYFPESAEISGRKIMVREDPNIRAILTSLSQPFALDPEWNKPDSKADSSRAFKAAYLKALPRAKRDQTYALRLSESRDEYFKTNRQNVVSAFLNYADEILSDPRGKKLKVARRSAPYAHKLDLMEAPSQPQVASGSSDAGASSEQLKANSDLVIRQKFIEFLDKQSDEFFSEANREKSKEAIYQELYGDRFVMIRSKLGDWIKEFDAGVLQILEQMNHERVTTKLKEGKTLTKDELSRVVLGAYQESSKPGSQKSWGDIAGDEAFQKKALSDAAKDDKVWTSQVMVEQRAHLVSRATRLEKIFKLAGGLGLLLNQDFVRDQAKESLSRGFRDLARMQDMFGLSKERVIQAIEEKNKKDLKDNYLMVQNVRETRERQDRSFLINLPMDMGHMVVNGAKGILDSTYRMVIENLAIRAAWEIYGDEGFDEATRFFGQFSNSNFSEASISGSNRALMSQVLSDSLSLYLTLMGIRVGNGVKGAVLPSARFFGDRLATLGSGMGRHMSARQLQLVDSVVSPVGRLARGTKDFLAKERYWFGLPPTQGTIGQGMAKGLRQDILANASAREAQSTSFLRDVINDIKKNPKKNREAMKAWWNRTWPSIKPVALKLGIDSGWLVFGSLVANQAALNGQPSSISDQVGKGMLENAKIMLAFMATHHALRRWPMVNKLFSMSVMNDIYGNWARSTTKHLFNNSEATRDFFNDPFFLPIPGMQWLANHALNLDLRARGLEIDPPLYAKYLKLGDHNQLNDIQRRLIGKDPQAEEIMKEYQEAIQIHAQAISSQFLMAVILGGPALGSYANKKEMRRWELDSRNSGAQMPTSFTGLIASAYGQNPKRSVDRFVDYRKEYLRGLNKNGELTEEQIDAQARDQASKTLFHLFNAAYPENMVKQWVIQQKLRGVPVEELRPMLETYVREQYQELFKVENPFDSINPIPFWRAENARGETRGLETILEKFQKGFDEGLAEGNRILLVQLSLRDAQVQPKLEQSLRVFQAFSLKLDELEKKGITDAQEKLKALEEVQRLMGDSSFWNSQEGQIIWHQIVAPKMLQGERTRGSMGEFMDVDLVARDSSGKARLTADEIAKVVGIRFADPNAKADMSVSDTGVISYKINGKLVAEIYTTEKNGRFLVLQDIGAQNLSIKIPENMDLSITRSGKIMIDNADGTRSTMSFPGSRVAPDQVLDFNLRLVPVPTEIRNLQGLAAQGNIGRETNSDVASSVRVADYWLNRRPEGGSEPSGSRPRQERYRGSVLQSDLSKDGDRVILRQTYLPDESILIQYSGEGKEHPPRNLWMPDGWELNEAKGGVFIFTDRFGIQTEIDFKNGIVKFYDNSRSQDLESRSDREIKNFFYSTDPKTGEKKPMSLDSYDMMLRNFSGFLPSETYFSMLLMGFKSSRSTALVDSVSLQAQLKAREEFSQFAQLGLDPKKYGEWGPREVDLRAAESEMRMAASKAGTASSSPSQKSPQEMLEKILENSGNRSLLDAALLQADPDFSKSDQIYKEMGSPSISDDLKSLYAEARGTIPELLEARDIQRLQWFMVRDGARADQLAKIFTDSTSLEKPYQETTSLEGVSSRVRSFGDYLKISRLDRARQILRADNTVGGPNSTADIQTLLEQGRQRVVGDLITKALSSDADSGSALQMVSRIAYKPLLIDEIASNLSSMPSDQRTHLKTQGIEKLKFLGRDSEISTTSEVDLVKLALEDIPAQNLIRNLGADQLERVLLSPTSLNSSQGIDLRNRLEALNDAARVLESNGIHPEDVSVLRP